jgi:CubicO group peptidase (beta-lactamase class C family)
MDTRFRAVCEAAAIEHDLPCLAVGTALGDAVEELGIGCAADARFRVASVTKPFTAALALELLDLEQTTTVWPADVRVRHLLSHTSGFDSEHGDLFRYGDGDDALGRAATELGEVRRFVGIEQVWSYSNAGYWLASWLAAERAGTTFEDALAARIFARHGLEATAFDEPDVAAVGPEVIDGPYPRARRGSGGLVSNVQDLTRYGRGLLASRELARMRIPLGRPPAGVYGLGLWGYRIGGVEVWGHPGSYGGYRASLLVVPDRDAVFVGLTSSQRGERALREIEDAFFERVIGSRRPRADTVELDDETLEGFTGTYASSEGWGRVEVAPGGLLVTFEEGTFEARPVGEAVFEFVGGELDGERFDFPLEGFVRFGSRLTERVE